jgi:hypothetical protein
VNKGRFGMLVFCCVRDINAISKLVRNWKSYAILPIDNEGKCKSTDLLDVNQTLYYSEIQFLGLLEPKSGKKGLNLISDCIVYNSFEGGFLDSFAHYRDHSRLHAYTAIFMEAESTLAQSKQDFRVGGKGSITVMRPKAFDGTGEEFTLSQYSPGEIFHISAKIKA